MAATPNSSAVTSLDMFDLSGDGKEELLVGRRDGTVQVYNLPESHDIDIENRMIYQEVSWELNLRVKSDRIVLFQKL